MLKLEDVNNLHLIADSHYTDSKYSIIQPRKNRENCLRPAQFNYEYFISALTIVNKTGTMPKIISS